MRVVAAVLALDALLDHAHQHLAAEVALGRLGVGVDDEGVGDLEAVRHLLVHPRRTTRRDHRRGPLTLRRQLKT